MLIWWWKWSRQAADLQKRRGKMGGRERENKYGEKVGGERKRKKAWKWMLNQPAEFLGTAF